MARQPKIPTLTLSDLAQRQSLKKLAKRFGVTERTVKGWLAKGPSKRAAEDVRRVLVRAEAGYKAAATKRSHEAFRESLQRPPAAEPEIQVLPKRPPVQAPEVGKIRQERQVQEERQPYETEKYEGFRQWFEVNRAVPDVDVQAVIDAALFTMENRIQSWMYINFLFYRYIPYNPNYTDSYLVKSQGKWVEWFTKTPARASATNIEQAIQNVFDGYEKRGPDGRLKHVYGAVEMAEKRVLFLGSYQIVVLKSKPK